MSPKVSNIIKLMQEDAEIQKVNDLGKRIKVNYKLYSKELGKFQVGAIQFRQMTPYEFEKGLKRLEKIQAYLDRMVEIRLDLVDKKTLLLELYQQGSVLLSGFSALQKVRTKEQRDDLTDQVLRPISIRRERIQELLDTIENSSWNLKNTHNIISSQYEFAKQILFLRNPERYLKPMK